MMSKEADLAHGRKLRQENDGRELRRKKVRGSSAVNNGLGPGGRKRKVGRNHRMGSYEKDVKILTRLKTIQSMKSL